jgi:hypothetical protein
MTKAPQPSPLIRPFYCRADSVDEAIRQLPQIGSCKFFETHRSGSVYQVRDIEIEVLRPSILDVIFFRKLRWLVKVHYKRPPVIELPCPPPPPSKP